MRIRVERDTLADAVSWSARTLPARPPVPVLAGLLIEAEGEQVTLSSFDYEVSARVTVDAVVDEPGTVLVSGRLLAEITRSLPAKPVSITTEGTKVRLECGSSTFSLPTLPVEEYPTLPEMPAHTGTLTGDAFAAAVAQVAVAAGRDDTLPVLTGIRMEIDGDTLTLAATDRYRLAVREIAWSPDSTGAEAVALVPARTLADTAKSLAGAGEVSLALASGSVGEGLLGIEAAGRRTTSRLLDGEFPKYRSLLPAETLSVASLDTATFVEAVRRVALVAERNTPVRLSFTDGQCQLDAGTGDDAQASETLEAELTGDPITIAFNPGFLLDGLGAIDAPKAVLSFTTSTKPAVLTGRSGEDAADGAESAYRYLLMPVRLSG